MPRRSQEGKCSFFEPPLLLFALLFIEGGREGGRRRGVGAQRKYVLKRETVPDSEFRAFDPHKDTD